MDVVPTPPAPPPGSTTLASQCVRALLERHGIPRGRQAALVNEALGLSYSQANRRLTTAATWALEDLQVLAAHFGETLVDLVAWTESKQVVDATASIDGATVTCRVALGGPLHKPRAGAVVATKVDGHWVVTSADQNLKTQAYDVVRLMAKPVAARRRRLAVLDDDGDEADSIATYLREAGFEVEMFTAVDRLLAQVSTDTFDAYVLDWVLEAGRSRETARDLIAAIRSHNAHCPIVVLTGQLDSGVADVEDVAAAMVKYRFRYFTKPTRLPLIAAELSSLLAPS